MAQTNKTLTVETPDGPIEVDIVRKKVRNLNLRIRTDGSVTASAPGRVPLREVQRFLDSRAQWLAQHRASILARPQAPQPQYSPEQCLAMFTPVSDSIFPLFADILGGRKPELKVRTMKSRWGVCHIQKRRITLNTHLAGMPPAVIEYVVLHEYVHFLHPDHGEGFHAEMARLMPDYKQRRKQLRQHGRL